MFKPHFNITNNLHKILMEIEKLNDKILDLPITPKVLAGLRESARLSSTHYSTYIEGNRLTQEQIERVIHERTWAKEGFLEIIDQSKKARKYGLNPTISAILKL